MSMSNVFGSCGLINQECGCVCLTGGGVGGVMVLLAFMLIIIYKQNVNSIS